MLLQLFEVVLLLLKPFLYNFSPGNDSLFHFLHDFVLNLIGHWWVCDWLVEWKATLFQEWLKIVIGVILINLLFNLVPILLELLPCLVIKCLVYCQNTVPDTLVFLRSSWFDLSDWLIGLFFHLEQLLMLLLNDWIIVFLLIGVYLPQTENLVPRILSSDRFNLALIHMVNDDDFFLDKINCDFGDLLFGLFLWTFFELSWHFLNADLSHMVIIVVVVFCRVYFIGLCFHKRNTLSN